MRLFMTDVGKEAWFSALVRNVRLEITRYEIGALDVFSLSGAKQAGQSEQQFRANNYDPAWTPNYTALLANDVIQHTGGPAEIGYWKVRNNDGGLILRVPHTANDMKVGNVRIYAKNTGPYPYQAPHTQAYKQYQEVYDNQHGGEILLFTGFAAVASNHWKAETEFPFFTEVRLAIYADGLFNNLDRRQFGFEGHVKVIEVATERELLGHTTDSYGVAVIKAHTRTGRPAVAYRTYGTLDWVAYPLHENFYATIEEPESLADAVLDGGLLDFGVLDPPPIIQDAEGVVVISQPRLLPPMDLTFVKKDVTTWSSTSPAVTINISPNNAQPYLTRIRVADLAFIGKSAQLYLVHNGSRHRLCNQGKVYNTPVLTLRHGDTLYLDATVDGPISSMTGTVYAELNEPPLSADVNNVPFWLMGKVSVHVSATIPTIPTKLDYGLTGRRISGYTWDEFTPEQYVTGLGYDLYGVSPTIPVTFRVVKTKGGAGGTGYTYGTQSDDVTAPSFLETNYRDPSGREVIRRGVSGLPGTALHVFVNGVDRGVIATVDTPEGALTINISGNDRVCFRAILNGRPYDPINGLAQVLPAIALDVEAVTREGKSWLLANFDLAATFGPDILPPVFAALPTLTPPASLPVTIGANSFDENFPAYLINRTVAGATPSLSSPVELYGNWFTLMGGPNPTVNIPTAALSQSESSFTGTVVSGYKIELEKLSPWAPTTPVLLASHQILTANLVIDIAPGDAYRIKVTIYDPGLAVKLKTTFATDFGPKSYLIYSAGE